MKWKLIDKTKSIRPTTGTYKDWKSDLAKEGDYRCVYCAIFDRRLGGIRMFHVEHYKPKSIFKELINDYDNLYYVCPICNSFKSNSWFDATSGDWNTKHYPCPTEHNYGDFFIVDLFSFKLDGNHIVGKFLIQRLHLNRPHLMKERRFEYLSERFDKTFHKIQLLSKKLTEKGITDFEGEINELKDEYIKLTIEERKLALYTSDELS